MLAALLLLSQDPAALVQALADPAIEVREDATLALRRLAARADASLETGLAHSDAEVRARALMLLLERLDGLPDALVARQPRLRDERVVRRAEAAIAKIQRRTGLGYATRELALQHCEPLRELHAIGAEAVPVILRGLDGPARPWLVLALGLFDDRRAAAELDRLAATDEVVRVEIGG
jgi:hypothetical protein